MIERFFHIFFQILFFYCFITVAYLFILSFCGKFFYRNKYSLPHDAAKQSIAILVPAYKEDEIIISTSENLLQLDYPTGLFDIYIIADSFQASTLDQLKKMNVHVFEVTFEKSTKTKSLNEAFARISRDYDIALICDADNILSKNFLKKIDTAFINGAKAIQGKRVAKNLDTSFAILDACSEAINNHIFRRGANALGLSSAVIGSGMAFDFMTVKKVLQEIEAIGGFDKILQLKVVAGGQKIFYVEDAVIFDEKIDSSKAFKQQRKRWVSSQFIYLKKFFFPAFTFLFRGNLSYFILAVFNNIILPRSFLFILLPFIIVMSFFISTTWIILTVCLFALYILALIIAIPPVLLNRNLLTALLQLPRAIFIMFGTILHLRKANKSFIHTVHTKTTITNKLFNEPDSDKMS